MGVAPGAFSKETFSDSERAAIGFSTELLTANHNPNADLIAENLSILQGYWSPEDIQAHAKKAWHDAARWLEEQGTAKRDDPADQRAHTIQTGHTALEAFLN